jgi:hypothetical protein
MAGGRPSKLTPELLEKARKYVDKPLFEQATREVVVKDQIQVQNFERPTWISVAGLACEIDVARSSIYAWADQKSDFYSEEFSDIFEALQKRQELLLEYHGATRGYDSGFAKFLASNLTKYKDKIIHDTTEENKEAFKVILNRSESEL